MVHRHQVIPNVLPKLKAAGYQIVDVAACLGQVKYQEVGEPSPRDVGFIIVPFCPQNRLTDALLVNLALLTATVVPFVILPWVASVPKPLKFYYTALV